MESTGVNMEGSESPIIPTEITDGIEKSKDEAEVKISKREQKRLLQAEMWAKTKTERRKKEKERRKKRKLEKMVEDGALSERVSRKKLKETKMANSSCKVGIVVDLSFESYMDNRSIAKCIKQVHHCYSINRRAANPVQFHVTSLIGKCLTEMKKHQGYQNWDVRFHENHFSEVFDTSKVVYLTSESENTISKLEDDKIYVIGGLVDHNSQKGLCHKLAVEKGLNHGRLPLEEHIDMKTRRVLTIDHVFNILVNVGNGQQWREAFLEVLPARKGAKDLSESNEDEKATTPDNPEELKTETKNDDHP